MKRNAAVRPAILGLIFLAFTIRLVLWHSATIHSPEAFLSNDSPSYYQPALALSLDGTLALSPDHPNVPMTLRTPGYPLFIAGTFLLLGHHIEGIVFVQILVSLLPIALVYRIASRVYGKQVGSLAAILLAADAVSLGLSLLVLAETLFTLFIALLLWTGLRFIGTENVVWAILGGMLIGLSTLVRPITSYLPVFLLIALFLLARKRHWSAKQTALTALCLLLPIVMLVGGWKARNAALTGHAYLSQIEGINLLFYRGASVLAQQEGISLQAARDALAGEAGTFAELRDLAIARPDLGLSIEWQREGIRLLLRYPFYATCLTLRGLFFIFVGTGESILWPFLQVQATHGPLGDLIRLNFSSYAATWFVDLPEVFLLFLYGLFYLITVYAGTAFWIVAQIRRKLSLSPQVIFLGLIGLYLVGLAAGAEGYYRFRAPAMPVLAILAASGLSLVRKSRLKPL